jgi:ubiquinone/menaquinone biosynthesis C-methylase UbiE
MHHSHGRFSPECLHLLKDPQRREWLPPQPILETGHIRPGEIVVDLGAGTGFWTESLSALVGEHGRVYAVDVEPVMLDELRTLVRERNLHNVEVVASEEYATPLEDGIADLVVIALVLHEPDDPMAFLREVVRLLKPDGRVLVIDWQDQPTEHGPPVEIRISAEEARALLGDAGLSVEEAESPTHEVYVLLAREFHPGDPEATYPTA